MYQCIKVCFFQIESHIMVVSTMSLYNLELVQLLPWKLKTDTKVVMHM